MRSAEARTIPLPSAVPPADRDARLRAIFDFSPFGIAASDRNGLIVESNAAYQRMLGYTAAELHGRRFIELSDPDAGAENARVFAEMVAGTRDQYVVEKAYRRSDGRTVWARVSATAVRDATGVLEYSVAMVEDITERRRMAQALADTEQRHRSLLESLPVIIYESDPDPPYATHYVSSAVHILGYSLEEWLRSETTWVDSLHPDDRDRVLAESETAKRERRPFQSEYRLIARDGAERWFHDHGDFLYDDSGAIAWRGIILDITERKHAELKLRRSEELFRSLTEQTSELITIFGADGTFKYVSPTAERVLGWTPDDLLGRLMAEILHPDDVETAGRVMESIASAPGQSAPHSIRVRHKNGSWRVLEGTGTNLLDHPVIRGIVSNARDVTDRVAAEEGLRFQAHLLDTVEQGVLACDREGRILYWNRGAERILGWRREDVIGRRYSEVIAAGAHPDNPRLFEAVVSGEGSRSGVRTLTRRDGTSIVASGTASPLIGASGAIEGLVGVFTDITAQRQLEDQLRQSQKMEAVGKLAGGIAHDFNNLLTVIIGRAEFMRMAARGGGDWTSDLEEIREAAGRAASLTRQLLAYSRKQLLQPKVLQLNDVVDALAPMLTRLIGEDVELVQHHGTDIPAIHADPNQLEQVVVNLAVNARDAMPSGGVLTIASRSETVASGSELSLANGGASGCFCVLSVTDTGVGMDETTASHIFEPFFTTKEVGQGTGLGLSMVHGIVNQSGGFITVRSRLGMGTTFDLYLPALAAEESDAPKTGPSLAGRGGTETILLVEDSDAVRVLAQSVLRRLGYTVLTARNGDEALALAASHGGAIDLVLTDIVMPGMSGRELAEAIVARRPGVRVLYMSGYTDDVIIRKGLKDPGASFIEKPFTTASLADRVRQRLDT
jgi:two-component system, cell cycle sensor histidine kinase and response regulator CckA